MNRSSMWEAVSGIVKRDLLLAMRRRSDAAMSVFFLVIVASLFPWASVGAGGVENDRPRRAVGRGLVGLFIVAFTRVYG